MIVKSNRMPKVFTLPVSKLSPTEQGLLSHNYAKNIESEILKLGEFPSTPAGIRRADLTSSSYKHFSEEGRFMPNISNNNFMQSPPSIKGKGIASVSSGELKTMKPFSTKFHRRNQRSYDNIPHVFNMKGQGERQDKDPLKYSHTRRKNDKFLAAIMLN